MKKIFLFSLLLVLLSSCHNQEQVFDDYEYSTVYFAYQTPVRTITLGEDIFDTSLDNLHQCKIMATMGGVYTNKSNVVINFQVDNSLCDGILFKTLNTNVVAMPSNYYTLSSNQITIAKGEILGGVTVQLTDAFFADPLALTNHYVIPLVMTNVQNADSILQGAAKYLDSQRTNAADWDVLPKDYILYAIKYINPWEANYLRRGVDVITEGGTKTTTVRHQTYVEDDEVIKLTTRSLTETTLPMTYKDDGGNNINVNLVLTFDDNGNCTISSATSGATASGSGSFVIDGEKKSWGNTDRNALYLNYKVTLGTKQYNTTDTLVVRDRGVAMETFDVVVE